MISWSFSGTPTSGLSGRHTVCTKRVSLLPSCGYGRLFVAPLIGQLSLVSETGVFRAGTRPTTSRFQQRCLTPDSGSNHVLCPIFAAVRSHTGLTQLKIEITNK